MSSYVCWGMASSCSRLRARVRAPVQLQAPARVAGPIGDADERGRLVDLEVVRAGAEHPAARGEQGQPA